MKSPLTLECQLCRCDPIAFGSTNRIHEQFAYTYDAGGNLATRVNNDLKEWFTVDNLNQLTEVLRTNSMTVAGTTSTNASSVAINGSTSGVNLYADATFAKAGLSLSNGTNTFTAVAQDALGRSDTNSVSVWMPTTRALGYDNNGNLVSDGLRGFEYDDENQLIRITVTNAWMTEFVYDGMLRCRVRREKTWVSGAWQTASETRYVYHGRLVMQERDGNNQPRVTYTRGPDLSGSLVGAGGIGGLLARTENPLLLAGRTNSHTFYHADAGGNITALTDGNQGVAARYLYDPYGNTISRSGPLAEMNLYRFSSKELHSASGLYYYGFRFYDPNLQRWPNRDPLGEPGFELMRRANPWERTSSRGIPAEVSQGPNLYAYVVNDPLNRIDPLGLDWLDCMAKCIEDNDPLNNLGKAAATAVGGTCPYRGPLPKMFGHKLGTPLTTVPSMASEALGLGKGNWLRATGRFFSPLWVGYGLYLAGVEAMCAGRCTGDPDYYNH